MNRTLIAIAFLSLCISSLLCAQERLAVLPLTGSGVETSTKETAYLLLVSEIGQLKKYELVSKTEIEVLLGDRECSEADCAIEVGKQTNASKVVFGSLNKLGEKVILQYNMAEVSTGQILLTDNISALKVEDLDQVVKRVALSVVQQVPAAKTVEVGLVTQQESQDVKTRKAISSSGICWGYLYPKKGYDDREPVFVWDFRSVYELRHVAIDAVLGFRQGFALNVCALYVPGLKDFSPFVGGGVGFHGVSHEQYDEYNYTYDYEGDKREDGFEFVIQGGMLAFRTYDFRVVATVEYTMTFNDFDDRAVVLTLGVMRGGKKVFGIF